MSQGEMMKSARAPFRAKVFFLALQCVVLSAFAQAISAAPSAAEECTKQWTKGGLPRERDGYYYARASDPNADAAKDEAVRRLRETIVGRKLAPDEALAKLPIKDNEDDDSEFCEGLHFVLVRMPKEEAQRILADFARIAYIGGPTASATILRPVHPDRKSPISAVKPKRTKGSLSTPQKQESQTPEPKNGPAQQEAPQPKPSASPLGVPIIGAIIIGLGILLFWWAMPSSPPNSAKVDREELPLVPKGESPSDGNTSEETLPTLRPVEMRPGPFFGPPNLLDPKNWVDSSRPPDRRIECPDCHKPMGNSTANDSRRNRVRPIRTHLEGQSGHKMTDPPGFADQLAQRIVELAEKTNT